PPPKQPVTIRWDRLRPWLQLCRAPNVFTAMADPLTGALIVGARPGYVLEMIAVMLAAAFLYTGGIVLNDWNDYKKDLVERPSRPLPSGQIRRWHALVLGSVLLALGLGVSTIAGEAALSIATL